MSFRFRPVVKLPLTRGDCESGREARAEGELCPYWHCRHSLIGEMTRMEPRDATRTMVAYLDGRISSSCALDVADGGPQNDKTIAQMLGFGVATYRHEVERLTMRLRTELHRLDRFPGEEPNPAE